MRRWLGASRWRLGVPYQVAASWFALRARPWSSTAAQARPADHCRSPAGVAGWRAAWLLGLLSTSLSDGALSNVLLTEGDGMRMRKDEGRCEQ
jgi:hypothetical protein